MTKILLAAALLIGTGLAQTSAVTTTDILVKVQPSDRVATLVIPPSEQDFISNTLYPAVALLYAQDEEGSMNMLCTATMIEKTDKGYVAASAAHCASKDDEQHERVEVEKKTFYVTFDESKEKKFIPVKVLFCGYQHSGMDFCEFSVETSVDVPVIPLGKDPTAQAGEPVVNVASPLGLGKQVFRGSVSSPRLERPVKVEDINWENAILLQLPGTNGGSSGSAIVCLDQQAICGFLVGSIGETEIVAIPVSRLESLKKKINAGTYKYWKPESNEK